jgi:hypothetical protein
VLDITEKQKANHLNALKIISRVPKGLEKIERFKLEPREKAFKKALFISRQAARLADAAIDAEIGIEKFEALSPRDRHWTWNNTYEAAMSRFRQRPYAKSDRLLAAQLSFLEKFFSLPVKIHRMRQKHWGIVNRVIEKSSKSAVPPSEGLLKEIDRLLARSRPNESLRASGMDVCIAVSIFADIMEKRGENWSAAYQQGMELVYSKIKSKGELVDTIANL